MPRMSPYLVQLTEHERLTARARRYTSPYCDVISGEDRAVGRPGTREWRHCRALGYPSPDRQQVAQAVLHRTPPGGGGPTPRRAPQTLACELPTRPGGPIARLALAQMRRGGMCP